MICKCGTLLNVVVTVKEDHATWRILRCHACLQEITTMECEDEPPMPLRTMAGHLQQKRKAEKEAIS